MTQARRRARAGARARERGAPGVGSAAFACGCCAAVLLQLGAGRAQVLGGLHDAGGHAGLGRLAVRARVVDLLVADLALDLEHAVVVLEHVVHDRAGERVLGVGVDVHLHDAVVQRLVDLREQ